MNDFGDWLSPLVVKELRQGLRARSFVGIFLLLQAGLGILLAATVLDSVELPRITAFLWFGLALIFLLAVPLQGAFSVSGEMKAKTVELLLLTNLTARKIFFGKWAGLAMQSLLLVCAIMPYLLLRYFMGGVDLAGELTSLGGLLVGSILFSGVTVGASPYMAGVLGRMGLGLAIFGIFQSLYNLVGGLGSLGFEFHWETVAMILLVLLGTLLVLEFGLSKISPPGESNAAQKRLLALAGFAGLLALSHHFGRNAVFFASGVALASPVCLAALMEPVRPIPILYRPWLPRVPGMRWVGRAFYPGWPAGLVFFLLAYGVVWTLYPFAKGGKAVEEVYRIGAVFAAVLLPLAAVWKCVPGRLGMATYLAIQGVTFGLGPLYLLVFRKSSEVPWPVTLIPGLGISLSMSDRNFPYETGIWVSGLVAASSLGVLLALSCGEWRRIAAWERETERASA